MSDCPKPHSALSPSLCCLPHTVVQLTMVPCFKALGMAGQLVLVLKL